MRSESLPSRIQEVWRCMNDSATERLANCTRSAGSLGSGLMSGIGSYFYKAPPNKTLYRPPTDLSRDLHGQPARQILGARELNR